MKKIVSCDLCGSKDFKFLFTNQDRIYPIKKDYKIYRCKKCGLIFVNPQPGYSELSKHYQNYYSLKSRFPNKQKVQFYKLLYF